MKKKNVYIINLVVLFTFHQLVVNGQISKCMDSIASEYATKGFNGNILYSRNDSIVYTGNFGYAKYENRVKLNNSTVFELASCSKQFTALAIVQLIERNHFSYNTFVKEIIVDFVYENITVEHLLRHQSGLPDYQKILYEKNNWRNRKKMATNQDLIKLLGKLKPALEFEPGTKYQYSNTGYAILALIIEKVSGQLYKNYIAENIFVPAGMTMSKVYSTQESSEIFHNVALGYTFNTRKDKYQRAEDDKNHKHVLWMNGIVGDRGVYASILDLEKWKQALRYNILITKESMEKMTSVDKVSQKYGYGLAIYNTSSKGKWVYHNGSWSGYKASAIYLPDSNEYLVILSNNRFEETYKKFEEDLYKLIE